MATDEERFRELLLYVAQQSQNDKGFGAVKMHKLLFNADFLQYARTGRSISGQEYQKLPNGPAVRRLLPVQEDLIREGSAALQEQDCGTYTQKRLIALREPDLSIFSGDEIKRVDRVIERFWGVSATEMSDLSHDFIGWQVAEEGETIPYETVFLSKRPLTQAERERGLELSPSLNP